MFRWTVAMAAFLLSCQPCRFGQVQVEEKAAQIHLTQGHLRFFCLPGSFDYNDSIREMLHVGSSLFLL